MLEEEKKINHVKSTFQAFEFHGHTLWHLSRLTVLALSSQGWTGAAINYYCSKVDELDFNMSALQFALDELDYAKEYVFKAYQQQGNFTSACEAKAFMSRIFRSYEIEVIGNNRGLSLTQKQLEYWFIFNEDGSVEVVTEEQEQA